jgi:DNA-binding MarR family transcriptional regulator
MKKSFSDRLTPKQVQFVLREIGFNWDDRDVSKTGWVEFDDQTPFVGYKFSINIEHGGFTDFDVNGGVDHSGDLVDLMAYMRYGLEDSFSISMESKLDAIDQIRSILDFKKGIRAPELGKYYYFTNDFLQENSFTRIPNDLLRSNLNSNDKLVWVVIFSRCSPEDIYSFSSIRRIAEDLSISESTVQASITRLKKFGLVVQKSRGANTSKAKFPLVARTDVINEIIKNVL